MPHRLLRRQGLVLVSTLIFLMFLTILVTSTMNNVLLESKSFGYFVESEKQFILAESLLKKAELHLEEIDFQLAYIDETLALNTINDASMVRPLSGYLVVNKLRKLLKGKSNTSHYIEFVGRQSLILEGEDHFIPVEILIFSLSVISKTETRDLVLQSQYLILPKGLNDGLSFDQKKSLRLGRIAWFAHRN